MRAEKWDRRARSDGATYGQVTLERALAEHQPGDGWQGPSPDRPPPLTGEEAEAIAATLGASA
jgi:hypothetical protein